MDQIKHRFLQVNRLKLHVADIGLESSPAMIFLHGFPEIWYSWRHQMTAVANAGFRAIAPDFRGYGLSDSPLEPEKASYDDFVNDVVSILDSLHISKVCNNVPFRKKYLSDGDFVVRMSVVKSNQMHLCSVVLCEACAVMWGQMVFVIAKDFGTWIAYSFVLLHPEKIAGIITLGMAFMPPAAYKPDFTLPEGFYVRRWQVNRIAFTNVLKLVKNFNQQKVKPSFINIRRHYRLECEIRNSGHSKVSFVFSEVLPLHLQTMSAKEEEPGRAEADFGRFDVKTVVRNIYILFSKSEIPIASENQEIMDLIKPSNPLPSWFTEEDLVTYAALYEKSGFRTAFQVPYRSSRLNLGSTQEVPKVEAPTMVIMEHSYNNCSLEMDQISHRFLHVNGLKLHVAEIGPESSPVVIFLHGFPEIWYTWRHQMIAVVNAGFRVIAPDFRGYGLYDSPAEPEKGSFADLIIDTASILDALAISKEPGRAEADFDQFDIKTVVKNIYILFSQSEMPIASENEEIMDLVKPSTPLPSWFTEEDLTEYVALYEKSGFRFALQVPYRTLNTVGSEVEDPKVEAKTLLIIGEKDYVLNIPGMDDYVRSGEVLYRALTHYHGMKLGECVTILGSGTCREPRVIC
ncbi:putative epoxide hydrolase [Tanacetum coccineum]